MSALEAVVSASVRAVSGDISSRPAPHGWHARSRDKRRIVMLEGGATLRRPLHRPKLRSDAPATLQCLNGVELKVVGPVVAAPLSVA